MKNHSQFSTVNSQLNSVAEASASYTIERHSRDQGESQSERGQSGLGGNPVPVGYKQTEVGLVPEDWRILKVGEAFEIHNNLRLPISSKLREGMAGDYPYYGPTKIQDYINEYRVEGKYALIGEDGDHFLKYDTVPQTQFVKGKFNVNNHAHLVAGKIGLAEWFFFYFRNRDISAHLTRQGAGRFKLNKASLESIYCAVPTEKEQTAIANALSDVDALINELEKLISKKQAIKTAAMQQLLTGRTRLPQFALRPDGTQKTHKQTELGEIPEDWELVELGTICKVQGGFAFKSEKFKKQGLPILRISNIQSGRIDIEDVVYYSKDESIPKQFQVSNGDALIAMSGATTGKVGIYKGSSIAYLNQRVGKFTVLNSSTDVKFVQQVVMSFFYRELLFGQLEQGAQPNVSSSQLELINIRLPTISEEQTAIATILSDMDADIQTLQQRFSKTRHIKLGMMQELLTGKTRLRVNG